MAVKASAAYMNPRAKAATKMLLRRHSDADEVFVTGPWIRSENMNIWEENDNGRQGARISRACGL